MKEENIRVFVLEPNGGGAEERTIPNTLEALQELVDGKIEVVQVDDKTALIVDEEGKLKNKPDCMFVFRSRWFDRLVGTVVAVGTDGEEFCSLDDEQITAISTQYLLGGVMVGGKTV